MIEIHQSANAQKISFVNFELGRTAQAEAPTDPGAFSEEEPEEVTPPQRPSQPTFNEIEPDPVEEPEAPAAPTAPTSPGEVADPGEAPEAPIAPEAPEEVADPGVSPEAPVAPTAPDEVADPGEAPEAPAVPTAPDEVADPGEAPEAPIAPEAPEEVADPGEAPAAPVAPEAPEEVADPGEAPEGPGEFTGEDPEAPTSIGRLEHIATIKKLSEKVLIVIEDVPPQNPEYPVDPTGGDGGIVIPEEPVPLADVPVTGDISGLWMAMSGLSAGLLAMLNKKKRK